MARTLDATSIDQSATPEIREPSSDAPYQWLSKGWDDFKSSIGPSLSLGCLFVVAGIVTTLASWSAPLLTITFVT